MQWLQFSALSLGDWAFTWESDMAVFDPMWRKPSWVHLRVRHGRSWPDVLKAFLGFIYSSWISIHLDDGTPSAFSMVVLLEFAWLHRGLRCRILKRGSSGRSGFNLRLIPWGVFFWPELNRILSPNTGQRIEHFDAWQHLFIMTPGHSKVLVTYKRRCRVLLKYCHKWHDALRATCCCVVLTCVARKKTAEPVNLPASIWQQALGARICTEVPTKMI